MSSFLHNIIDSWNTTLKYTLNGEAHSFKESHNYHMPWKKSYIMINILNPVKESQSMGDQKGTIFQLLFF